jgi:hypothetical protein
MFEKKLQTYCDERFYVVCYVTYDKLLKLRLMHLIISYLYSMGIFGAMKKDFGVILLVMHW